MAINFVWLIIHVYVYVVTVAHFSMLYGGKNAPETGPIKMGSYKNGFLNTSLSMALSMAF